MGMPTANSASSEMEPAFGGMVGLFLNPDLQQTTLAPTTTASASQIADAMIRSMLGGAANATTSFVDSPSDPANTPAEGNESTSVYLGKPLTTVAPKQPRSLTDLPVITVVITPAPTGVVIMPSTPDLKAATTNSNSSSWALPTAPAAVPPRLAPPGGVAFTAILTPVNPGAVDGPSMPVLAAPAVTQANVAETDPAKTIVASTEPAIVATAAAETQTTSPAPANKKEAPSALAQALGSPVGASTEPKTAGDAAQHDDSRRDDSPKTPTPAIDSPDAKLKSTAKQDDSEANAVVAAHENSISTAPFASSVPAASQLSHAMTAAANTPSLADALRTSEAGFSTAPPLRTGAAQEIAIRIAPPDAPAVDLRIVERSGQIHVDVRTADATMQTSLRQDLGTLTNSLQRAGYHAETSTPTAAGRTAASAETTNQGRQDPSQNRNGSGDFSGGRQQPNQQKRSGTWLEELEEQS